MKERMVVDVHEGGTLLLTLDNKVVGQPVTIPEGVTSVTIVFRDTAAFEEAKAGRAARRNAAGAARRPRRGDDKQ